MERLYTKIIGTAVVEEDHIRPLTMVQDLIIHPDSGKLIAFVVNTNKNLIITPNDVIQWQDIIKVSNHDVIIKANEVIRVDEVTKKQIYIFHNNVETKKGKYLGRVYDFSIDTNTWTLQKLYISKGFLGLLRYDGRIIPASHILEILPNKIVVKDDMAVIKEKDPEREVLTQDMALS